MEDLTEEAKKIYQKSKGFVAANNYNIIKVSDHYCEMEGIIKETSVNPFGMAHGGYIFGLADTAAGVAAMTDKRTAVTIDSSIEYLVAAKGKKIKAIAKCLKAGKKLSFFEVSIYDEDDTLVAVAKVNYCYLDKDLLKG